MTLTRDQALAALSLTATPDADAATIQLAFERLARRYPQPHFPERFRQLLDARDQLLDAGRIWREQLESRTLDFSWLLPHLMQTTQPGAIPDRRTALQAMLRAGYRAEPLRIDSSDDPDGEPPEGIPF